MRIVIIGGGAAGFFAAINSARRFPKHEHVLIEATGKVLTKVLISGGGRCNVTHHCFDPKVLVNQYPRGRNELLGAFHRFQAKDTCEWFTHEGVGLKHENDGRMFPQTNKSKTVAECLISAADRAKVSIRKKWFVRELKKTESGFLIESKAGDKILADRVLLATGGSPLGFSLAEKLGHTIEKPVPSLFTFNIDDPFLSDLSGQSVNPVKVELSFDRDLTRKKYRGEGPLLITHWGFSGPAILRLSAFAARTLAEAKYRAELKVNWIPDYHQEACYEALKSFRTNHPLKSVLQSPPDFPLSKRLWKRFMQDRGELTWGDLNQKSLRSLAENLCGKRFCIDGKSTFKEEFVTCGGVRLSEVDFQRMESRKIPGLFFAGEILDVDGVTGGFNFQNAWTTGWIAAQNIGKFDGD